MAKAHLKVQTGGIAAALEAYRGSPTPNVIIIEHGGAREELLDGLDRLAEHCDLGTKLIVIGRLNDVHLYRELTRRGVSDYLIAPISCLDVIRAISVRVRGARTPSRSAAPSPWSAPRAASAPRPSPTTSPGRSPATSSSTRWWSTSICRSAPAGSTTTRTRRRALPTRCSRPSASTPAFIDRLMSKCADHLSLLAAPATLERTYDFDERGGRTRCSTCCAPSVPWIVLDMPHLWTGWAKRALTAADEILIVADARPRLAAQRQEPDRPDPRCPAERPAALLHAEPDRRAEAARDPRRRLRQGARARADRGDAVRAAAVRRCRQQRPDGRRGRSPSTRSPTSSASSPRPSRARAIRGSRAPPRC